ncbi:MAG: AsmA family protein [Alphaproteobacteria bacterium]|nr:AsmA family protein [Alphaproteobacteria bacterium]
MKLFGKKDKDSKKTENLEILEDKTTIKSSAQESSNQKQELAKINPIKIPANEAIDGKDNTQTAVAPQNNPQNSAEDANANQVNSNNKPKSEFEERVDKVIASAAQLFAPFKDLMLKVLPSSRHIIKGLDYIALGIASLTRIVVLRFPILVKFLKSIYFKIIVVFLVFMFIFGVIFSKIINSSYYVNSIETAIYKSTGFQAKINGVIKVSFIPRFSISLNNISFYKKDSANSNATQFRVNQFDAANLQIDFKFLPLFIGNFSIKNIDIIGATLNLQTADVTALDSSYAQIIANVERAIKSSVSNDKIKEITAQNTSAVPASNANEVLDMLDNLDSLITNGTSAAPKKEALLDTDSAEKSQNTEENQESNAPISSQEFNDAPNEALITPKEDSSVNYGFLSRALSSVVNNIKFSFNDVDNFTLRRSKINIINNQGQKIISAENISAKITTSFTGKVSAGGGLRFADSNIEYNSTLQYKEDKVNFTVDFILDGRNADLITLSGYKNTENGDISADLSMKNQGILLFINKFLFEINSKKIQNSSFEGKLLINSNFLKIDNINMILNDNRYQGSFTWDYASSSRNIIIDILAEMKDMSPFLQGITSTLNNSVIKDSTFLASIEEITNWKNSKMSIFRPQHFIVNFKAADTAINNITIDSLNIGFLLDSFDKLYIYNTSVKTKNYNAEVVGRVDLENKTALLALESQGSISVVGQTMGFSPASIEFLQNIGKNKDAYSISSKLRLENNKLLLSDFVGFLGDLQLNDTYIIYSQRVEDSDILVSTKIKEFNFEDIADIYARQIANLTYEKIEDINIFGLPNNFKVKINMDIAKSKLRGVPLKNASLDISLFKTGFNINKFSAVGERGGSISGAISADSIVLPVIAGHINLEDLVLNFEDTKNLFLKTTPIVGNVVLNGKIKFNGDTFDKPFSNIDGDLSFIKQERILVNRLAITDGLFLTLSKKKLNGVETIYVNDIYGRANIKNNIIELYPIALLYIDNNNKEYRGVMQLNIDLGLQNMRGSGEGEQTADTRNKMRFDIAGDFLNPTIKTNFYKGEKSSAGVKPKEKEISLLNNKTHKVVDGLNDTKSKTNFNNTYNSNIANKSYDNLKNKLYEDMLEDNTKGKATYPNPENRKPNNDGITKGKDNTTHYGNQ